MAISPGITLYVQNDKPRPILVTLSTERNKRFEILKNAFKLKGTNLKITADFTKKALEEKQKLREHLILARNNGYTARISYNKLVFNGEFYKVSELENIDSESPYSTDKTEGSSTQSQAEPKEQTRMIKSVRTTNKITLCCRQVTSTIIHTTT